MLFVQTFDYTISLFTDKFYRKKKKKRLLLYVFSDANLQKKIYIRLFDVNNLAFLK